MKGPGEVPSFKESKESPNRKRVKECFEKKTGTICISQAQCTLKELAGVIVRIFKLWR